MIQHFLKKHLNIICIVFIAIFLTTAVLLHSLSAQLSSLSVDDMISSGKTQLFQKTIQGSLDAHQTFKAAALDPAYSGTASDRKIKIRVYLAFTRLLDLVFRSDGGETDTLTELLAKYGLTRTGTTLDNFSFDPTRNNVGAVVIPATAPSGEAMRSFLAGPFLAAVNASISDMDEVITLCGSGEGKEIIAKGLISATQPLNAELDAGDYYLFRASLKLLKTYVLMISAYNLDVDVSEIVGLINADNLNFKNLLDRYPNLLNKITSAGTPADNGVAKLAAAKAALSSAIDDYTNASERIRNDVDVTFGAEELIAIAAADLLQEKFFREELAKIKASLDGTADAVYEFVGDKETWEFTDDVTQNKIRVTWRQRKSEGWCSNISAQYNTFVGNPWRLQYTTVNGADLTLRVTTWGTYNGQEFGAAEFRGTLSSNGMQLSGTYRTGYWSQSWAQMTARGTFNASLTAFDDSEREKVNLNALFGNGTQAPGLRDLLPEFTDYAWGIPKVGTMGHGLGNDATLNGLLPDFTQTRWAQDSNILQPSGTASITAVSDGAITIDGLVGDWAGINPVFDNTAYGDTGGDLGRNIAALYLAQDGANLYLRMDTMGARLNENGSYDYAVKFTTRPGGAGEMAGDMRLWASYKGYKDQWTFTTSGETPKQLMISLWGATNDWGNYSQYVQGSGTFAGPAGDAVFPQTATLQSAYISGNYIYIDFGSFSFNGTLNNDRTQISSGSFTVTSPSYSYGNFTGVRTGHAPYWQAYLSKVSSLNQWSPWQNLGDNMAMGLDKYVEWKVPLGQVGNLAGLFIQPEIKLWSMWWWQGVTENTTIRIGPMTSAQTVTGTLTVPGYDGTGVISVGVFEYHGYNTAPEYRLGSIVFSADRYTPGMTYTIPGIPPGRQVFVAVTWDRYNNGSITSGDFTEFSPLFTTVMGTKTFNVTLADDHLSFPAPEISEAYVVRLMLNFPGLPPGLSIYEMKATVSGPSPADATVTVVGPSGQQYTLLPDGSSTAVAAGGMSYRFIVPPSNNLPVIDGEYIFEVVDARGRKATVTRSYAYDGAIPNIDIQTLLPGNGTGTSVAYTGTTTPTLTWAVPANMPDSCRWQVSIWGSPGGLFKSELLPSTTNSYTIPADVLLSNSLYQWDLFVWNGAMTNASLAFTPFHTGNRTTAIPWANMITEPPTITNPNFVNYVFFEIGVLPQEITEARLKNAAGEVLATTKPTYYYRLYAPGFYQFTFDSTLAPADSDYTVEVDVGGETVTSQPIPYAYHTVLPLDPLSLFPANNHYFNTLTPTFSWALTAAPQAWYQVRLFSDVKRKIEVYRSSWMKNATSWTVPEGILKQGRSYAWRLYTSSDYDPLGSTATGSWHSQTSIDIESNNSAIGVFNTFTISTNPFTSHLKGDLDNDGTVDLADAILGLQLQAGMKYVGIRQDYVPSGVDANGDNKLGLAEIIFILQKAAGLRD